MSREIHAAEKSSDQVGGCCGCTENKQLGHSYRVWEVTLRVQSLRLCDACLRQLKQTLASAFATVNK